MGPRKIGGIALIVVGAVIAYTGYDMSGTVGSQIESTFTGSPTDSVMLRYVLGGVSAVVGVILAK